MTLISHVKAELAHLDRKSIYLQEVYKLVRQETRATRGRQWEAGSLMAIHPTQPQAFHPVCFYVIYNLNLESVSRCNLSWIPGTHLINTMVQHQSTISDFKKIKVEELRSWKG